MLKVLIVDDEITVRRGIMLGVDWRAMDCQVVGDAANGAEGLEAALRLQPDLIITDVRMPKMDGIEMLTALRERGCKAHAIMLTAYGEFEYARSALKLGAEDYLLKPFRDQELAAAIARVRQKRTENAAGTMPQPPEGASSYVRQATDYIARHYADEDISIAVIAAHLGVSEGHLSHVFKKEIGSTVISYLTQYRIQTAMALLKNGGYKVYEVAQQVGYRDVAYFSSTFRKLTGLAPSEYQEQR